MTPGHAAWDFYNDYQETEWHRLTPIARALWDGCAAAAVKAYLANIGRAGGKRGGKATTPRKVAAARINGRKNRGS